jgi:hypothetical protein
MTRRAIVLPLAFGLSTLVRVTGGAPDGPPPQRPAPRVYTNEDLERVHRFRDQTGVHSVPAEVPEDETTSAPAETPRRGKGEDYWRREAARVRDRVLGLEGQAAELRARIADRAREQGRLPTGRRRASGTGSSSESTLRAKLEALERRMRRAEDDLLDRARRDGALPGWLR